MGDQVAVINKEECTACGVCADACNEEAITVNDFAEVDSEKCTGCGTCVEECPVEAISLKE
jgi:ferredoxin